MARLLPSDISRMALAVVRSLGILLLSGGLWPFAVEAQLRPPQPASAIEQLLIYEINRARNNPARFASENSLAVDLTSVAPQPPLAVNENLVGSARFHAEEMASFNYVGHQSAVTGDWPNKMARDNGYVLPSFYPVAANNIESFAAGTVLTTAMSALIPLLVDAGEQSPGHRIHLLAMDPFFQTHREIGTGFAFNAVATYRNYLVIQTAVSPGASQFLTGVVYVDANGNGRYDLGEGLGGITVSNGVTSVVTNAAGGWSMPVNPGVFTVTAFGGSFGGIATATVTVAASNVEVDFASGIPAGEVSFARQGSSVLAAAVLPSSRSVQVGTPVTVFATLINAGPDNAIGCTVAPITSIAGAFHFQTTDPATNHVTGTPDAPTSIVAGAAQSFVLTMTPAAPIASVDLALSFSCDNASPAVTHAGLNTLLLSASASPVPDIVALAATLTGDGIVNVPDTGVFAVATINLGAGGAITASADTGGVPLPLAIALCETNPVTGICLGPSGSGVTTQVDAGETPTFGIFVARTGNVPFDPATNRIFVRFTDAGGITRGATSVAVRTQ